MAEIFIQVLTESQLGAKFTMPCAYVYHCRQHIFLNRACFPFYIRRFSKLGLSLIHLYIPGVSSQLQEKAETSCIPTYDKILYP